MKTFQNYLRIVWGIPQEFKPTKLELKLADIEVPKDEPFRQFALEACVYHGFRQDNYSTKTK